MNYIIRTYANTKAEKNAAEQRLKYLLSKKEEIYTKYFPLTSKISDLPSGSNRRTDPMADYLIEITAINKITNMSLEDEIEDARNHLRVADYYLKLMENTLRNTTGIENELFSLIIIDGYKKTAAVKIVAEKYKKEERTIWKYHYSRIKKEILKCTLKVQ